MRELKFRAWDYTSNVMRNDITEMVFNSDGTLNQINVEAGADILFPEKECVLMQYTGLKDKNGKEIYEGDLVKIKSKPYIPDEYIIDAKPVIFMNGLFCIKKSEFVRIPIYLFFNAENITHDIEVIGNIHENNERKLK